MTQFFYLMKKIHHMKDKNNSMTKLIKFLNLPLNLFFSMVVTKKCYYSNTSRIILFDFYSSEDEDDFLKPTNASCTNSPTDSDGYLTPSSVKKQRPRSK